MIRDGIKPRLLGLNIVPINLSNSKTALIIRVPKSWISPHRVTFKGQDKFYSRSTNGKYPMDVGELRVSFNLSETITARIRKFREDRISKIFANETPVPFYDTAKIVLHLIPIVSFNPAQSYDIDKIVSSYLGKMSPISGLGGLDHRYNLEGFLTYSGSREERSRSYVQLFKNGIIEAADGSLLKPRDGKLSIPGVGYERKLIESLTNYFFILKTLNVEPPIFIFLTLLGVKGYSMADDRWGALRRVGDDTIDRDILFLPEIVIESYDDEAKDVLRPCFDSTWNACGFPRSLNSDDAGE